MEKTYVTYEDFGAVGDGKTNDFEAILRAHEYANEKRLPVSSSEDKTYYISDTEKDGVARTVIIKTDADWHGAKFIIDDTNLSEVEGEARNWNSSVFKVTPYEEKFDLPEEMLKKVTSLKKTDTKIDVALGYPAMLILYYNKDRIYIRTSPGHKGMVKHELILVDGEGNIDPTTPIMHDYPGVSKIEVIRADIPPLTLQNATFICRASHVNTTRTLPDGTVFKSNKYFVRNLIINRSNTTLQNIKNYVEGEITLEEQADGITGPPYSGFYTAREAHNVLLKDCVVTARRYYAPGTYGFSATLTNNIVLKDCVQSNFYVKDKDGNPTKINSMERSPLTKMRVCWGLGGTNYCKNMVYDGCEITRFDAHQGLCNGKIINSKCSYINLIGYGEMLIENCLLELKDPTMFQLRADYGSTWEGEIIIRNCNVEPNEEVERKDTVYIMSLVWYNRPFGYVCHYPNITLDNVRFTKREVPIKLYMYDDDYSLKGFCPRSEPMLHKEILSDGVTKNLNVTVPPKYVRIINNHGGHKYYAPKLPVFENTEFEGFIMTEE